MKWISLILMLSALLLAGCRDKQIAERRETSAINVNKVTRLEPDIQIRPNAEPGTTDFMTIKTKADMTDDVGEFVTWLKTRTNVSNVVHSKSMYLTSNPPKQVVSFHLDGVGHRLIFTAETNKAFKLL